MSNLETYKAKSEQINKNLTETRRILGMYPEKINMDVYQDHLNIENQQIGDIQYFEMLIARECNAN